MNNCLCVKKLIVVILIVSILTNSVALNSCVDEELQGVKSKQEEYHRKLQVENLTLTKINAKIVVTELELIAAKSELVTLHAWYSSLLVLIVILRGKIAAILIVIKNLWKLIWAGGLSWEMIKIYMAQISYLAQRVRELKKELGDIIKESLNVKKTLDKAWQKYLEIKQKLKNLKIEKEQCQENIKIFTEKLRELGKEELRLKKKLQALERKISNKKREISKLEERIAALEAELRQRREEEGDSCCPGLVAEIEALKQKKAAKKAELADLEEEHGC